MIVHQARLEQRQSIRRRSLLVTSLLLPITMATRAATHSVPTEVAERLPNARLQGSGRLTYFGLQVYDARLWAVPEFRTANYSQQPLALELEYARSLNGKAIAERSIEEMRRQASLTQAQAASWLAQMNTIFPNVDAGDRITSIQRPNEAAIFFVNGRPAGEIRDPDFAPLFFGIWLSAKTSEPALRKALVGGAGGSN